MKTDIQSDSLEVKQWKTRRKGDISIFDPKIIRAAIPESFKKLDPRVQLRNPVMFVVEVGVHLYPVGTLSFTLYALLLHEL